MSNKFISNIRYRILFSRAQRIIRQNEEQNTSRAMKLSINTADKCPSLNYPSAAPKNLN